MIVEDFPLQQFLRSIGALTPIEPKVDCLISMTGAKLLDLDPQVLHE